MIRLDLVKRALRTVLKNATGVEVVWATRETPRVPRPYLVLQVLSGPSYDGAVTEEKRCRVANDDQTLTFAVPPVGDEYLVRVNGIPVRYTATTTDPAEVRDAVLTALNDLNFPSLENVNPAASGSNQLVLTATQPGALLRVDVSNNVSLAGPSSTTDVLDHVSRRRYTVSVTAVAENPDKYEEGAVLLAERAYTGLSLQSSLDFFADQRVSAKVVSGVTDLSGLEPGNAKPESRATFDVDLFAVSLVTEEVATIETVEFTLNP